MEYAHNPSAAKMVALAMQVCVTDGVGCGALLSLRTVVRQGLVRCRLTFRL